MVEPSGGGSLGPRKRGTVGQKEEEEKQPRRQLAGFSSSLEHEGVVRLLGGGRGLAAVWSILGHIAGPTLHRHTGQVIGKGGRAPHGDQVAQVSAGTLFARALPCWQLINMAFASVEDCSKRAVHAAAPLRRHEHLSYAGRASCVG